MVIWSRSGGIVSQQIPFISDKISFVMEISHCFGFENLTLSSLLFRPLLKMSMHMVVYHCSNDTYRWAEWT